MSQREEVLAVLGRLADAWNSGDATAYASLFTEDADYVTFFGMRLPGRELIESSHQALFQGPLRGSTIGGMGGASVRFPADGVAVVVSGGGSALDGGDAVAQGRESTVTFVLVRSETGWLITAFQNTRVSDPRAAA
ncbi:SgcJ/EcaC family oxidoreductase [Amycolatopsis rhabdoformis]|uniref:SgcJ/EcaC family oxidoreductase n=1 Tax=Amycolatopsis rhabdoformis TaxID=1448059 RepID=A0ABZ1IMB0_9PSEU|nr:SgcJ/EcaC family oxidoreductase [Amycolatopsis rhabdoformis]WSE34847.1 SgcJ/EcaC family oxidoreductase [Amycolatopsis rhabdoformis]